MRRIAITTGLYVAIGMALLSVASYFVFVNVYNVEISFEQPPEVGDMVRVKMSPLASEVYAKTGFSIEPEIEGELVWHDEQKELHFVPNEGFEPDKEYKVSFNKSSTFSAALPGTSEAFTFSSVSFNRSSPSTGSYIEQNRYIDVNLSTMTLTLIEDGKALKTYPVAGKGNPWTAPTREGTFTIKTKEPNHFSRLSYVWMPWSMQYSGNYFIHEWPHWPNGARITSKYSSGCIRLFPGDAKEVYDWAKVGTTVVVHSTADRLPVFAPSTIESGDLVRERSESNVYIIKKGGNKTFKRHAWTDKFGSWYDHLSPFWQSIKLVQDGSLDEFITSRWVRVDAPSDMPESRYIYELDISSKTRHLMLCGETPLDSFVKPENCDNAWIEHGWPPAEIYTISLDEFNAYAEGEEKILQPSSSVIQ